MNLSELSKIASRGELTRFLDRHYRGSVEDFYRELNGESDRLIRTDLKASASLTTATLGLEKLLPDYYRAHLYRIWGRHYHISSDYNEARRLYGKSISLFDRLGEGGSRARVEKALVDVLMYLGRYDEARQTAMRSLAYYRRVKSDLDSAQVMTNLGNLYHRLDQNRKALGWYDKAHGIFKRLKNDYAIALVQFNRGNIYSNLNHLREAEKLYGQAAEIYRSLGMELAASQADYSLASMSFLKGEYSRSLSAFSRVAESFRRLGDRRCLALTELDRVEVNLHLNLYSQAIEDAGSVAADFRDLGMSYEEAKAYYFAASAYLVYGDFGRVGELAGKAQAIFAREDNRVWQVLCRFLKAKVDCLEGRHARGIQAFRGIAAFYRRRGDIRRYHDVRLAWLEALISSGKSRGAATLAGGIKLSLRELAGYQRYLLYLLSGDLRLKQGRAAEAARLYRQAIEEARRLQATIFPDEIRRFFWMDKLAAYNRLAKIYLESSRERQAFDILERSRMEGLIVTDAALAKAFDGKVPAHLEAERAQLKSILRKAMMPVGTTAREAAAGSVIRSAEHRLWKIDTHLREKAYGRRWAERKAYRDFEAIQGRLRKNERLVHYVCREGLLGAFIIGRDDFVYLPFGANVNDIRGLLARLYFLITRARLSDDDEAMLSRLLSALAEMVTHPVLEAAGDADRLAIVADGLLHRLPFYALPDGDGKRLFERYEMYLYSSASSIARHGLKRVTIGKSAPASVLAAPETELPGAAAECDLVAKRLHDARRYFGIEACGDNLTRALSAQGGIVHLAAHAAQSYENPLFSPILLADGPFYPFDLMSRPVRSGLVVLSGCQTGDPGLYYTYTTLSLAQSFTASGAGAVVASHWPVADDAAGLFMDNFYSHLVAERDVLRALRTAMAATREVTNDIRHWAPFYLSCR